MIISQVKVAFLDPDYKLGEGCISIGYMYKESICSFIHKHLKRFHCHFSICSSQSRNDIVDYC